MMTRIKCSLLVLTACFLSACVATYKAADGGVAGYRDYQINKTSYYVEYTEAGRTTWEQVHDFALKRCAEITQKRGYTYFDVVSKKEETVSLESDVNQIAVSTMGNIASDPPVSTAYTLGGLVEGKRVIYRIELVNE